MTYGSRGPRAGLAASVCDWLERRSERHLSGLSVPTSHRHGCLSARFSRHIRRGAGGMARLAYPGLRLFISNRVRGVKARRFQRGIHRCRQGYNGRDTPDKY